ncbi:MAG: HAMP domain-containing histidine kinase [Oscillospiraceae bacterium]|nr:HAMP domain-containing histidine kinase [Oscillospiraceae bacterium]
MKKKNKIVSLQQRLTRFLVLPSLTLWLLSMAVLTWAVGNDFSRQLEVGLERWSQYASVPFEDGPAGYPEYQMLQRMSMGVSFLRAEPLLPIVLPQRPSSISSDDWFWGKWDYVYGYQAAFGFYDHQGNPLLTSGGKYLAFPYWQTTAGKNPKEYGYIDFSTLPDGKEAASRLIDTFPGGDHFSLWTRMRFEGSSEGARFFPKKLISENGTVYYENPEQAIDVALYVEETLGFNYDPGSGFLYQGKYYESPALLLDQRIEASHNFFSTVITSLGSNTEFITRAVVHCSPFLYAVQRLWPVYLVSGILLAVCLIRLRKRLKQDLWEPFWVINRSFHMDRTELSDFANSPIAELQELSHHFHTAQQERHEAKNECQRLQTALDYAKDAEQNRKKLVSAVAHELKTPIAVIHSYAEGLQAGIAQGKEEQYLDIIRQETQRMDEMVLEMLELSRLEAGKVSLNVQQFSLMQLCKNILTRLEPAIEAKELKVNTVCPGNFPVSADEKRMEQVLSNLLTNAVKYTPAQGTITIKLICRGGFAHFSVENECSPLSPEEHNKVFDSFYRADTARDRSGTGLGLAIVKSILSLHRGECQVRNTDDGVEFSFRIPL